MHAYINVSIHIHIFIYIPQYFCKIFCVIYKNTYNAMKKIKQIFIIREREKETLLRKKRPRQILSR